MIASLPVASIHVVVPSLAVLLFLAFLVMLVVVAKIASSATRGPKEGSRGCLGGCGLVAVLGLLALLSIAGFVAFVATLAGVSALEHNPIKSIDGIYLPSTDPGLEGRREGRFHLIFEVEGDVDRAIRMLERRVRRFDRRRYDGVEWSIQRRENGARIDVSFPLDERELEDLERELEWLEIDRPDGFRIELESQGWPG